MGEATRNEKKEPLAGLCRILMLPRGDVHCCCADTRMQAMRALLGALEARKSPALGTAKATQPANETTEPPRLKGLTADPYHSILPPLFAILLIPPCWLAAALV